MRRPQPTDIKIDCSEDFPEEELFSVNGDNVFGITRKDWICGTDYCDHIQMVAMFEIIDREEYGIMEDDDNDKYPFIILTALMVHPRYFSQDYINSFKEDCVIEDGKYPVYCALQDAYNYGGGIPINPEGITSSHKCDVDSETIEDKRVGTCRHFKTFDDAEKYIRDIYAPHMNAIMGLIGFSLDRYTNQIGTTGWDFVYNMTEGRDLFKPAFDRMKDVQKGDDN
jgi:hypothetical protein